jgi:hypothetical protein
MSPPTDPPCDNIGMSRRRQRRDPQKKDQMRLPNLPALAGPILGPLRQP